MGLFGAVLSVLIKVPESNDIGEPGDNGCAGVSTLVPKCFCLGGALSDESEEVVGGTLSVPYAGGDDAYKLLAESVVRCLIGE